MMMKNRFLLWVVVITFLTISCSKQAGYKQKLKVPYQKLEPQEVEIIEFNKALFALDTANFEGFSPSKPPISRRNIALCCQNTPRFSSTTPMLKRYLI